MGFRDGAGDRGRKECRPSMAWCDCVVESDRVLLPLLSLQAWDANFGSRVPSEAPNEGTLEGDFGEIAWSGRKEESNSAIVVPL